MVHVLVRQDGARATFPDAWTLQRGLWQNQRQLLPLVYYHLRDQALPPEPLLVS
jgi:hypothetical protein